jgi:hypothetical protein
LRSLGTKALYVPAGRLGKPTWQRHRKLAREYVIVSPRCLSVKLAGCVINGLSLTHLTLLNWPFLYIFSLWCLLCSSFFLLASWCMPLET